MLEHLEKFWDWKMVFEGSKEELDELLTELAKVIKSVSQAPPMQ